MAKKPKKPKAPLLTLEEQLRRHDEDPPPGPVVAHHWLNPGSTRVDLEAPSSERMAWAKKRLELVDAIRRRDSKALRDTGRDASGNFSPSPYAQRGHVVETTPKALGEELPKDSQFPKRITTQRVLDRYRAHNHISLREWRAGNLLLELWHGAGLSPKMTAGYEPVVVKTSLDPHRGMAARMDAGVAYLELLKLLPYRSKGCVVAVVTLDWTASDWARARGYRHRDSERHGINRLRPGLQALADYLGL